MKCFSHAVIAVYANIGQIIYMDAPVLIVLVVVIVMIANVVGVV